MLVQKAQDGLFSLFYGIVDGRLPSHHLPGFSFREKQENKKPAALYQKAAGINKIRLLHSYKLWHYTARDELTSLPSHIK